MVEMLRCHVSRAYSIKQYIEQIVLNLVEGYVEYDDVLMGHIHLGQE